MKILNWIFFFKLKKQRRKLHSTANVNVKVEICRGNKQWFIRKKKGLKVILFLVVESVPMHGVGLVSCDVFLVGGYVPVFWLLELDLFSLKGSAVSSSTFLGVYGSVCLWAVLLTLAVLDTSTSTAASKWLSQHIFTGTSPLPTCPWNLGQCFCSPASPCTAG